MLGYIRPNPFWFAGLLGALEKLMCIVYLQKVGELAQSSFQTLHKASDLVSCQRGEGPYCIQRILVWDGVSLKIL